MRVHHTISSTFVYVRNFSYKFLKIGIFICIKMFWGKFFKGFFKLTFREGERESNIDVRTFPTPYHPLHWELSRQPLVHGSTPNQLSHTDQGWRNVVFNQNYFYTNFLPYTWVTHIQNKYIYILRWRKLVASENSWASTSEEIQKMGVIK